MSIATELLQLSLTDLYRESDKRCRLRNTRGNQVKWEFRDKSTLEVNQREVTATDGGYSVTRTYE